ncbi:putative nonribosomal peptide synthase protein [Neofusicoccum parvum]|uniref:Nonribosomal peptide synthase protein n=1 Tax=Neofusicoccum parvum TaxID=310453 RepID=A0ACB5SQ75_9PEZI|nr:putative nonribosomal peptide synthase protein [Neofusicoccum parvum]
MAVRSISGLQNGRIHACDTLLDQLLGVQTPKVESSKGGRLVHNLIEAQAEETPDAVAVQFETETYLTYQQLNEVANSVARHLICGRGTIVPIAVSRSPGMIIALLAVLKTGAAYTLLSPETPTDRIRYVLADSRAPFLIVDHTTHGLVPGTAEVSIDKLLLRSRAASADQRTNLNVHLAPSDTAYIIYTSGTTGKPKGVVLSHGAAVTGLAALPQPGPTEKLRQLLSHAPNFSAAQRTVLGTLSRGGTLCLASKEGVTVGLPQTLRKMEVSSLEITPSMLRLLDDAALPETITRITLGGEPVSQAIVAAWAAKVELFSAYGLSECTQLNMRQRILPGQPPNMLGKPTDSTICYVLSPGSLSPVPVNVPGELCLGGNQLAEGYLNMADKTREVFVPNPFGSGRLYRTGDMVTIREDGSLELLGRIDQQIKIDGQRVEPNEANSVIQLQPGVAQSAVVSVVHPRPALAAAVVSDGSKDWATLVRDVRKALLDEIPAYAIPRYWLQLDSLPLSTTGKVDVAKLVAYVQALTPAELTPGSDQGGPQNEFESAISQVAAELLHIEAEALDLSSSFQELGGTSLDAIVLASKLRHAGIHLAVPDILQSPSLRGLAERQSSADPADDETPRPFSLLPDRSVPNMDKFEDVYPVTPLQEGILADSILSNANYVYQRVYRIRGVSLSRVRSALEAVVAQNPIYRTSFIPWKKGFVQMVRASKGLVWEEVQGKSLDVMRREAGLQTMALNEPLVRAVALDGEYLILQMHHALFDYWSRQFLVVDAVAMLRGEVPVIRKPLSVYVAYQQRHAGAAETRGFWREYLAAAPEAVLNVPKSLEAGPDSQPLALTAKIGDGLVHLSHAAGVTVGTAVHAAWALTLAASLASDDVVFITEFSGRDADIDGILDLAGPTLCTAPIRVGVDRSKTAVDFTKSVQANLWNLSKFAPAGLRNALAAASIKPTAINTMVNVLVELGHVGMDDPLAPVVTHVNNFTQFINIEVTEDDPTVAKLLVPYAADVAHASRTLELFKSSVKWLAENPQSPLHEFFRADSPFEEISPDEIPGHVTGKSFGLAHAAFEAHAAANPSKTALVTSQGQELSYGELNGKANSFAEWLLEQGVEHGEMIPLYMEKSAATLIAILGIIKAGAAFTPLDPRNPAERNTFIAADVAAKRVVTDAEHKAECAVFNLPLIVPDELDLDPAGGPLEVAELTPSSHIYAIYTSGSTGLPKGVLVPHSAVTASTEGMIEATATTAAWRSLWVLNYVFDASYYDVFTVFAAGATLCVAPQDDLLSDLTGHINRMGVEQVMLTPTITKLIRGGPAEVPRLKVLNVCGEKIDVNILEWAKSVDVYNGYGPTEATILMTVSKVEPDGDLNSIGLPLKHVEAVIVHPENNSLQRVADGQVGELCVRGAHLAKGYINRPDQTEAAFVKDTDGQVLYRTGDLAKWADDGSLICLGRKDYQVKLNGFRIELGEIENAILKTGAVDAVVVSVAELAGKRQLVAFCIFSGDHQPSDELPMAADLRLAEVSELKQNLRTISHYMMPSLFLPFHSFPTLASGKANRKKLVALVESMDKAALAPYLAGEDGSHAEFKAVETDEERIMQQAWATALGEEEDTIGASSAFAALGGDSISAINVVAECRRLSYSISVADVLSHATLAEQAKKLKRQQQKTAAKKEITIPSTVRAAIAALEAAQKVEDVYPCGPGQTEFLIQGSKKHQFWNLTACRDLPQDFHLTQWRALTERLTAQTQILRSCYYQADLNDPASWYQIVLKDSSLNWEELCYETDEEKVRYMEELRDSTFTFGKAHVKYRLLHSLANGSRTLCIKIDHGSYDGTLLRIFDEQFAAMARGEADPPVHSFRKYIDWAATADHSEDLEYWKKTLSTYKPTHNLPSSPIGSGLRFATIAAPIDAISSKLGVTPSTVFLAAYLVVAGRLTGTRDVLLDNLITGRNAPVDSPQLLNGTCANFLPYRRQLPAATPAAAFLADVQAHFWETTEHGGVGLQQIYDHLGRDRAAHAAKLLYCFQPFDPAARSDAPRWLVMAQSRPIYMTVNYALMVEVQKTLTGYRLKLQWDGRALSDAQLDGAVAHFESVFRVLESRGGEALVGDL